MHYLIIHISLCFVNWAPINKIFCGKNKYSLFLNVKDVYFSDRYLRKYKCKLQLLLFGYSNFFSALQVNIAILAASRSSTNFWTLPWHIPLKPDVAYYDSNTSIDETFFKIQWGSWYGFFKNLKTFLHSNYS